MFCVLKRAALAAVLVTAASGLAPASAETPNADAGGALAPTVAPAPVSRSQALFTALFRDGAPTDETAPYALIRVTPRRADQMQAAFASMLGGVDAPPLPSGPMDALIDDLTLWRDIRSEAVDDWARLSDFVARRSDWPDIDRFRARAEWRMPEGLAAQEVAAFFAGDAPRTARGKRLFGEALIGLGRVDAGERWIVEGWAASPAHPAEEALYLANHAALLEPHHADRLAMHVTKRRFRAAQSLARRLPAEYRTSAEALTALMRSRRGAEGLVERVPASLRTHPSFEYARHVWTDRRDRSASEAHMLQASLSGALGDAAAWADNRLDYARDAYEEGRYADAVALAATHGLSSGADFAALEWFAGWVALTRLDDAERALGHFERMWASVETPISSARAAYWAGRAAEALGRPLEAALWYEKGARYPGAFYGQLSVDAIGEPAALASPAAATAFDPEARFSAADKAVAAAAAALYRIGEPVSARRFLRTLADRAETAAAIDWIGDVAARHNDPRGRIVVAQRAARRDIALWGHLFPTPRAPDFTSRPVEAALLLSIARQESRFTPVARSHAGALGLMQVMPATAREAARNLGLPYNRQQLLGSPTYNLTLAAGHMDGVLRRYRGSYVLAVAAYNAGEGNVNKWIARFGDPRAPDVDPIAWAESIPFEETRNYVQRVLEGAQVYRVLLGEAETTALSRDLGR